MRYLSNKQLISSVRSLGFPRKDAETEKVEYYKFIKINSHALFILQNAQKINSWGGRCIHNTNFNMGVGGIISKIQFWGSFLKTNFNF